MKSTEIGKRPQFVLTHPALYASNSLALLTFTTDSAVLFYFFFLSCEHFGQNLEKSINIVAHQSHYMSYVLPIVLHFKVLKGPL